MQKKSKRPVSRLFWNYLKYLPASIRAPFIRSKFEVDYDLPENLIFKQAETEDEITQALNIVHDSYVELDYMDANEAKLRFSSYHALPSTVHLIAKIGQEVVGTLSIIQDSAIKLPVDSTWNIDRYRNNGNVIAEISSLTIKKGHRRRKGMLFLPLAKLMYIYCRHILRLDGIVMAATLEVEPFYTDILLFEKVVEETGQTHDLVKGNPSTCCFLKMNDQLEESYKAVYNKKAKKQNLYHFFVIEKTSNILIPEKKKSVLSYLKSKNQSIGSILSKNKTLINSIDEKDRLVINSLDIDRSIGIDSDSKPVFLKKKSEPRYPVREEAWLFINDEARPIKILIYDVSPSGVKFFIKDNTKLISPETEMYLVLKNEGTHLGIKAKSRWIHHHGRYGASIVDPSAEWSSFVKQIADELSTEATEPIKATG